MTNRPVKANNAEGAWADIARPLQVHAEMKGFILHARSLYDP